MRGVANLLGVAIERQRIERDLRRALDRQQILMREVNHRVNNSLQIVAGMLQLQASGAANKDVRHELREAGIRIAAVARAHQRLYRGDAIEALDLGEYLREVCNDISASLADTVSFDQFVCTRQERRTHSDAEGAGDAQGQCKVT